MARPNTLATTEDAAWRAADKLIFFPLAPHLGGGFALMAVGLTPIVSRKGLSARVCGATSTS